MALSNYGNPVGLLLAKSVAYAAKEGGGTIAGINEIDLLADGAIAIFTENNVLVTTSTTATNLLGVAKFWVARGNGTGTSRWYRSELINRDAATRTKTTGSNPVKQAIAIGTNEDGDTANTNMNFPSTLEVGTFATIVVTNQTNSSEITATMSQYQHMVLPIDDEESIIQGLVDAVNADDQRIVDATVIETTGAPNVKEGILLTARDYFTRFSVGVDDIIAYADVTTDGDGDSVVGTRGRNSYSEMKELEVIFNAVKGQSDTAGQNLLYSAPSQVDEVYTTLDDSSTTMDTYTFEWLRSAVGPGIPRASVVGSCVIGFVKASAVLTSFETILGVLMTVPNSAMAHS